MINGLYEGKDGSWWRKQGPASERMVELEEPIQGLFGGEMRYVHTTVFTWVNLETGERRRATVDEMGLKKVAEVSSSQNGWVIMGEMEKDDDS